MSSIPHIEQLRAYASALLPTHAEESSAGEGLVDSAARWFHLSEAQTDQVRRTLGKLRRHEPFEPGDVGCLEAIIIPGQRPVADILADQLLGLPAGEFFDIYDDPPTRARVEACLPAIGRLDLPGDPSLPYAGTGFVVGPDLVMTNRHVAQLFASGVGRRRLEFLPGARPVFDPRRERPDEPAGEVFAVSEVLMIHPYWDMALLRVSGLRVAPLRLRVEPTAGPLRVVAVGYPAFDPRNDPTLSQQIFRGRYNLKRLAPGYLDGRRLVESFGRSVRAALHDSSTLGGNSGSAILDVATGQVVGLHFGGRYLDRNFAVPAAELAWDRRVVDTGVQFAAAPQPRPLERDWDAAWTRSEPTTPAPERTIASTTTASTTTASTTLSLTLPLELTVRLGQPTPASTAPTVAAPEAAPALEPTGLAATATTTQCVLVELTLDDAAAASAAVRRAADELGLLARGWHVTGPIDARAPRRCIELLAPPDLDMRAGWDVAHALRERLAARPELAATAEPELALELSGPEAGARGELEGTHGLDLAAEVEPNWHLDGIRARAAWALSRGASVRIGHPDTGTTAHPILAHATILAHEGLNLLELGGPPTDPLTGLGQPGHGTATSSLMVSPDGPLDGVSGLAPAAELVPIRVTNSVVILTWQARLARAIDHAVDHRCHVISMSLGGLPGIRLRRAIERAHARGVIVVAAAGNVVQFVVWPAAYPEVIAVAATGPGDRAWSGSSKGTRVAVTAPGHRIVVADWHRGHAREWPGSGTSYATALVASAAALWLARHGVDNLRALYPGPALPQAFRAVLATTATRPLDPGPFPRAWFGSGLLDCEALLRAPLPVLEEAPAPARVPASDELLAALLPLAYAHQRRADPLEAHSPSPERSAETAHQRLRSALAEQFTPTHESTVPRAEELSLELLHHVATDPDYREAVVDNLLSHTRIPTPSNASAALQRHLAATTPAVLPAAQALRISIPITIDIRVGAPTHKEPR